ncbi:MAG: hypothetical protein K0Q91_764 [Fibrobacteria bacterium]|jgi:hypothetical protein|nr:hypothetical protein [Fibrobacteria bacterium]
MRTGALPAAVIHRRLRVRGFRNLTEEQARSIETWMRLNPAVHALLFMVCGVTGSVPGLITLAGFFLIGILSSVHPFELFYTEIIRPLEHAPEMPPSPPLRRAVFGIGLAGSLGAAWAFSADFKTPGYLITGVMTASTAFLALTHICVPSALFRLMRLGILGLRRSSRTPAFPKRKNSTEESCKN